MYVKSFIFALLLFFVPTLVDAQTYVYTYTDPCTGLVKNLNVPTNGVTVTYYGQIQTFQPIDFTNGNFNTWANNVYNSYGNNNPCGSVLGVSTSVGIAQQTALNFISIINNISAISDLQSSIGGATDILGGALSATNNDKKENKKGKKSDNQSSGENNSNNSTPSNSQSSGATNNQSSGSNTPNNNTGSNSNTTTQSNSNSTTGSNNSNSNNSSSTGGGINVSNSQASGNTPNNSNANTSTNSNGTSGNSSNNTTSQSNSSNSNNTSTSQNSSNNNNGSSNVSNGSNSNSSGTSNNNTQNTTNAGNSTNSSNSAGNNSNSQPNNNSNSNSQSGQTNTSEQSGSSNNSQAGNNSQSSSNSNGQSSQNGQSSSSSNNQNGGTNGENKAPDNTSNTDVTKEEKKTNILGGTLNSVQNASGKSEGGKPTIVLSSDFSGFNFKAGEVQFGGKGTAGFTSMNWNGTKTHGFLLDYTSVINGPNFTAFFGNIAKRRIDLVSLTGTKSFVGRGSIYGTLAVGQMWSFPKVKSLKLIYLATASFGNIYEEKFLGTAFITGGMYDWKVSKRIDVKLMNLFIYAPYVSYYNDIVLKSPYVIMPIIGSNIGITKKFKFNINFGGAYAINENVMNYTLMFGTRMAL